MKKNIRIEMTHPAHFVHYTRIKYLLHSYAETSKRRHEFISCGLRSEKTQYRVSATALFGASFTAGFLVWEISQIFYRETQDGEKSKWHSSPSCSKNFIYAYRQRELPTDKKLWCENIHFLLIFSREYFNSIVSNFFQ